MALHTIIIYSGIDLKKKKIIKNKKIKTLFFFREENIGKLITKYVEDFFLKGKGRELFIKKSRLYQSV